MASWASAAVGEGGQRGGVAVHAEERLGDQQAAAGSPGLGQQAGRGAGVGVGIDGDPRPGQTTAVDEAGVVQGVGDDDVLRPRERGQDPEVRLVARRKDERRLPTQECRRDVPPAGGGRGDRPRPAGPPRRRSLPARQPSGGRGGQGRVIGEAEVVVGAERHAGAPPETTTSTRELPATSGQRRSRSAPAKRGQLGFQQCRERAHGPLYQVPPRSGCCRVVRRDVPRGTWPDERRMFHVEHRLPSNASHQLRSDFDLDLDEGPAPARVDRPTLPAIGRPGDGQDVDPAAGHDQPPAERQPGLRLEGRPRDRNVEPGHCCAASSSPRRLPRLTRPDSSSSRMAVRRKAPFLAIGSLSRRVSPGRSRASGSAGSPPPLPTSTTRAGRSSRRASAKASG